jgi:ArsR family transcriptional regulator
MQIQKSEPTLSSADLDPLFGMHAELCKALANEHRLKIMYALCHGGEKCVSELATEVGISVHNVSQHLRVLKQRLLVRSRKEGQSVYYSITNMKFMEACGLMRQALVEQHTAQGESLQAAGRLDAAEQGATATTRSPAAAPPPA